MTKEKALMKVGKREFLAAGGESLSSLKLLAACLRATPAQGFTLGDMRDRLNVLGKIEDAEKDAESTGIELSSVEAGIVRKSVREMKWGVLDKAIVEFCESVLSEE